MAGYAKPDPAAGCGLMIVALAGALVGFVLGVIVGAWWAWG